MKGQGGSGWTMCSAQELREHSSTAQPVPVGTISAHILKMLESGANQVCIHIVCIQWSIGC